MKAAVITTAIALWDSLQGQAGLELRRKKGTRGRDADLEAAVLKGLVSQLGLGASPRSVADLLKADARGGAPKVTTETLLLTVLGTLGGFASMMQEILQTLELAKASRAGQPIAIAFTFDEHGKDAIRCSLAQFRAEVRKLKRTLESSLVLPDADGLGRLRNVAARLAQSDSTDWAPAPGFPPISALMATGEPRLDRMLAALNHLLASLRFWCLQYGTTRNQALSEVRRAYADDALPEHRAARSRIGVIHNYGDMQLEASLHLIASKAAAGELDIEKTIADLSAALAGLARRDRWVERTVSELLDILNLPAWRKRHELYSVWAGTVLLRTAREQADAFHFNLIGGELSFAFGGSRLASYERGGQQYDVWAEMRSALAGASPRRKTGIQPDFRVLIPSATLSAGASTRFILECKHYLQQSRSNFLAAAKDYARSCPGASVFVVNHGPADEAGLEAACAATGPGRVRFLGDATVEREIATRRMSAAIRDTLFPPLPAPAAASSHAAPSSAGSRALVGKIKAAWGGSLEDVDLKLLLTSATGGGAVDFSERGDLSGFPYARLHEDVRTGPGEECIEISAWHFDDYQIVIRNHTHWHGELGPGHVWCEVSIGGRTRRVDCPPLGGASIWVVGNIRVLAGKATFSAAH